MLGRGDVKEEFIQYSAQEGRFTENAKSAIMAASQQDILDKINTAEVKKLKTPWYSQMSGIFLSPTNFSSSAFLSGIKRNSTGHIISATATRMRFWAEESVNFPAQVDRAGQQQRRGQHGGQHGDGGAGGQADSLLWGAAAWRPWRFLCL